jgi:hypothetical protein
MILVACSVCDCNAIASVFESRQLQLQQFVHVANSNVGGRGLLRCAHHVWSCRSLASSSYNGWQRYFDAITAWGSDAKLIPRMIQYLFRRPETSPFSHHEFISTGATSVLNRRVGLESEKRLTLFPP